MALLSWNTAHATETITVLISQKSSPYTKLVENIRSSLVKLTQRSFDIRIISVSQLSGSAAKDRDALRSRLVIAVGTEAATRAAELNLNVPILNTLIPELSFNTLVAQKSPPPADSNYRDFSAIFLDQPLSRQFELLTVALPEHRRVGVILGPASKTMEEELKFAARQKDIELQVLTISTRDELLPALNTLLAQNDTLLAIPDPLIHSPLTVRNLLLTTYRHQVPIVGFSHNYVKAGALMAVASTPEQIGQQIAETIRLASDHGWRLPPPRHLTDFVVRVNSHVARSLQLRVGNDNVDRKSVV